MDEIHIPPEVVEAGAKAICVASEINPMTLYQKGGFPSDPPTDHTDSNGRMFYYAWRRRVEQSRAAIRAAISTWVECGMAREAHQHEHVPGQWTAQTYCSTPNALILRTEAST